MSAYVVDTNVLFVANQASPQAGPQCVNACVNALRAAKEGIVVLDDSWRILGEYGNKLNPGQPGAGDLFLKWVHKNQTNPDHCEQVRLTLRSNDQDDFNEFPDDEALERFDRSDRKFVAVALASKNEPDVLNAVDRDWWDYREELKRHQVHIQFLCPGQFGN
jgi:hypothetical protein